MSDGEKGFLIILIALIILIGAVIYNQVNTSGSPTTEDIAVKEHREDFKEDMKQKEREVKPVQPSTPVPPVIRPIGEDYNDFRKNFKNLQDETDSNP